MAPTKRQIEFVDDICFVLKITDFPSSSRDYNKSVYSRFISTYIDEFYDIIYSSLELEDLYYENDVWCEYY